MRAEPLVAGPGVFRVQFPTAPPWQDSRPAPDAVAQPSLPPTGRPPMARWQVALVVLVGLSIVASVVVLVWSLGARREVPAAFAPGECADDVAFDGSAVTDVVKVDCAQLHQVEAFALVSMAGDTTYPGDTEVDARAAQLCRTAASAELVALDPGWQLKALRPSVDSWRDGDRTVTCFLTRASGSKTAGSISSG